MVLWTLEHALGCELLAPKMPRFRIMDVAGPGCEKPIVGICPGEKIHEEMISASDGFWLYRFGPQYAILPVMALVMNVMKLYLALILLWTRDLLITQAAIQTSFLFLNFAS